MSIRIRGLIFAIGVMVAVSATGQMTVAISEVRVSADIDARIPLSQGGVASGSDHAVFSLTPSVLSGSVADEIGSLGSADIDGLHDGLYSVDVRSRFRGTVMLPADVFDAAGEKVLDAAVAGIPPGANVNAVSIDPVKGDLVISFDRDVLVGGNLFRASHIIRFDGSQFSLFATTITGTNVDALHVLSDLSLLVSFDTGVDVSGNLVQDDEVVHLDSASILLAMNQADHSWLGADVDGLYAVEASDLVFRDGFE